MPRLNAKGHRGHVHVRAEDPDLQAPDRCDGSTRALTNRERTVAVQTISASIQLLWAHSQALLDRAGVKPGWSALDLGCGPRGTLELLSERVGVTGRVTGLDFNAEHVAQARELVDERRLTNVDVVQGDARHTGLPAGSFDLVHARLLLVTIPDPTAVVAELVRLARPGGWVLSDEADCSTHICHPPTRRGTGSPARSWTRFGSTAPIPISGADFRGCFVRQAWSRSRLRPEPTCTRSATPAARCASTSCRTCAPRSSSDSSSPNASSTSSTGKRANTWPIPAP